MTVPAPCTESIAAFLARDLVRWRGLPGGCLEEEVARSFRFEEGYGVSRRGSQGIEYRYRVVLQPGFEEGVVFYFDGGVLAFIETEYWSLDREQCAATLEALGPEEQTLDFYWKTEVFPDSLRLYAGRGLAVGVIPATQLIALVTVFPPCTPDVYRERYFSQSLVRELDEEG